MTETTQPLVEWKEINFNLHHPEQRPGYMYIANHRKQDFDQLPFKDKYRGETAYRPDGSKMDSKGFSDFAPSFVSKREYEEYLKHKNET